LLEAFRPELAGPQPRYAFMLVTWKTSGQSYSDHEAVEKRGDGSIFGGKVTTRIVSMFDI
jgi:hypothetical protein